MMTEDSKMMASFRVDREDWGKFGALAKGERLTVTQLLTDYIDWCLRAGKSMYGVRIVPDSSTYQVSTPSTSDGLQTAIDEAIEQAIAPIQLDLVELMGQVDRLEVAIDELKATGSKPKTAAKAVDSPSPNRSSREGMNKDLAKAIATLEENPAFKAALDQEIATGGTNEQISERLAAKGFTNTRGDAYNPTSISRFKSALATIRQEAADQAL
jgi:hypothetical protein